MHVVPFACFATATPSSSRRSIISLTAGIAVRFTLSIVLTSLNGGAGC
ncbi:MAG TPA: hypothetical protein PLG75_02910 [Methanoculleus sp.]|nr:hypothetical protein [Methanoculleus sp.]